jgi:diacylglycerol kinase (ATP)
VIALVANRASGRGVDPAALAGVIGATVLGLDELAAAAPARIVLAGGDGSIAPVAEVAGRLGVPLGVVPAGTANDFARANGLPDDVVAAARLAASGTLTRALELGRLADGHPFVNVASAGLASLAARRAAPLKPRFGAAAYALGAVEAALSGRPLAVAVRVDGKAVFDGRAWQVIVACTGAFGGGSGLGAADPTDGGLDVVVVPAGSRLGLARRAWGLRTHTIERQPGVAHARGRVVEVALAPGTRINCDGEVRPGAGLERVTVRPRAFELVVG